MHTEEKQPYTIVKLGGSLIVPNEIDTEYLAKFRDLILKRVAKGERFALIIGGGKTSRRYQQALTSLGEDDLVINDWMAIHALRLNAEFMRTVFKDHAHGVVINDLASIEFLNGEPIVIVGAEEPGHSSDYNAVRIAQILGSHKAAILSNIEYIYSEDPKKNPDAEKFEDITWSHYRSLIPHEWQTNMSTPIDPVASELAEEINLEVAMINGQNLESLDSYLESGSFRGTRVHG